MTPREEIVPVREAHRLNAAALAEYLKRNLEGFSGDLTISQFGYGQSNPTFLLSAGGKEYVLRKKPPGKLLPSAHAVDREYRIIKAMKAANVPVPEPYLLCLDDAVIGTAFYVMERVTGRIFRDSTASEARDREERTRIFEALNETLARIHSVDWQAAGLGDFGKPGNYLARQVSRWTKQYEASKTDELESMDHLIPWLRKNIPGEEVTTVVHGDYRLDRQFRKRPNVRGLCPFPDGYRLAPGRRKSLRWFYFTKTVNREPSCADKSLTGETMKTDHSRFKSSWLLLLPAYLLLTGCTEIFYFSQWYKPSSSYMEPVPEKMAGENRASLYGIDCMGGVICYGPDEERTSQKDGLVMKDCLWKSVPYKNGQPGPVWLTFSKKGVGCWQLHQERNEASKESPFKPPENPTK